MAPESPSPPPTPALPSVEVRFQFSEKIFRESVWHHLRHRNGAWQILTTVIGCGALAHVLYGWWMHPEEQSVFGTLVQLMIAAIFLLYLQWSLWWAQSRFRKGKLYERKIDLTFSPDDFLLRTPPDIENRRPWSVVREIVETPIGFLIYTGPNRFTWAPFSGLLAGVEPAALRAILRETGRPWRRME